MNFLRNMVKCNICGDIIESTNRHDIKQCKCGRVAIEGGHDYLRRYFKKNGDFTELSVDKGEDNE